MNKIRVLHLINSLGFGGAERMLEKLLANTDESTFSTRVVSLIGGGALEEPIRCLGIPVEDLGLRKGFPDPRSIFRLFRILDSWRPHVLQTWLYYSDLIGTLAEHSVDVPHLIWNIRCTDNVRRPGRWISAIAPKICARLSGIPDLVLSNSLAGRRFHEGLGYHPRQWRIIPNGFDLDTFHPDPSAGDLLRRQLSISEGKLLAGFVGGWRPSKDHSNLFRAARISLESHAKLDFVLAGSGIHWGNPGLRNEIQEKGLSANFHLLGEQAEVQKILAGLDFFILPSLFEGFPNVVGEALSCGIPCVSTRSGDTETILGDCGFLVPPGDPQALAAAVLKMADLGPEERARMGARGRARIKANFEIGSVARRYEDLYVELVEGRSCAD